MKLETKEEYLVDSAIEMLYPTVTFNANRERKAIAYVATLKEES